MSHHRYLWALRKNGTIARLGRVLAAQAKIKAAALARSLGASVMISKALPNPRQPAPGESWVGPGGEKVKVTSVGAGRVVVLGPSGSRRSIDPLEFRAVWRPATVRLNRRPARRTLSGGRRSSRARRTAGGGVPGRARRAGNPKGRILRNITAAEWKKLPRDYKTIIKGVHHVLMLERSSGATVLEPVKVVRRNPGDDTRHGGPGTGPSRAPARSIAIAIGRTTATATSTASPTAHSPTSTSTTTRAKTSTDTDTSTDTRSPSNTTTNRRRNVTKSTAARTSKRIGGRPRSKAARRGRPRAAKRVRPGRNRKGRFVRGNPRTERARALRTRARWHDNDETTVRYATIKGPPRRIPKTLVRLGSIHSITYESDKYAGSKDNPTGKQILYEHATKRPRPVLATDPDGRHFHIVGGKMKMTADGLVN